MRKWLSKLFVISVMAPAALLASERVPHLIQTPSASFNVDVLVQSLESLGGNPSLEDAIHLLPNSYKKNYTLVYHSRSMQGSTPLNPRAILFGDDARFIATFTGTNELAQGNAIEILQFDDHTSRFEMYSLHFPLQRDSLGHITRPARNPPVCLSCHTQDPKPNMSGATFWPGFYGGANDGADDAHEERDFQSFLKIKSSHVRYSQLASDPGNSLFPYRNSEIDKIIDNRDIPFRYSPNLRITSLLSRMNVKRAFRMIKSSPKYPVYREFGLYSLLRCGDLTNEPNAFSEAAAADIEARISLKIKASPHYVEENGGANLRMTEPLQAIFLFGIVPRDLALDILERQFMNTIDAYSEGSYLAGLIARDLIGGGDKELQHEVRFFSEYNDFLASAPSHHLSKEDLALLRILDQDSEVVVESPALCGFLRGRLRALDFRAGSIF